MNIFDKNEYINYLKNFYISPCDKDIDRSKYIDEIGEERLASIVKDTRDFCEYVADKYEFYNNNFHRFVVVDSERIFTNLVGGHTPDTLYYFKEFDENKAVSKHLLEQAMNIRVHVGWSDEEYYNEREGAGHFETIYYVELPTTLEKIDELKDTLIENPLEAPEQNM